MLTISKVQTYSDAHSLDFDPIFWGTKPEIDASVISADYWKLMNDGTIQYDGKKGLYDEQGRLLTVAVDADGKTINSISRSLLAYMGDDKANAHLLANGYTEDQLKGMDGGERAFALMQSAGADWNSQQGYHIPNPNRFDMNGPITLTLENQLVGFHAAESIVEQRDMRNDIFSAMENLDSAIANGNGSVTAYGEEALRIREMQGEYNRKYVMGDFSFTSEGRITQEFNNALSRYLLTDGNYLTYTHSGLDTLVAGNQVVSPGFYENLAVAAEYDRTYDMVLGLIGTDVHTRLVHINPEHVNQFSIGQVLKPGDLIAQYGNWGMGGGPHLHVESTILNSQGVRGFVNPLDHSGWYPWTNYGGYKETYTPPEVLLQSALLENPELNPEAFMSTLTDADLWELIENSDWNGVWPR